MRKSHKAAGPQMTRSSHSAGTVAVAGTEQAATMLWSRQNVLKSGEGEVSQKLKG